MNDAPGLQRDSAASRLSIRVRTWTSADDGDGCASEWAKGRFTTALFNGFAASPIWLAKAAPAIPAAAAAAAAADTGGACSLAGLWKGNGCGSGCALDIKAAAIRGSYTCGNTQLCPTSTFGLSSPTVYAVRHGCCCCRLICGDRLSCCRRVTTAWSGTLKQYANGTVWLDHGGGRIATLKPYNSTSPVRLPRTHTRTILLILAPPPRCPHLPPDGAGLLGHRFRERRPVVLGLGLWGSRRATGAHRCDVRVLSARRGVAGRGGERIGFRLG